MVAAFEKASEKVLFPCLVFVFVYFELYLFVILGFQLTCQIYYFYQKIPLVMAGRRPGDAEIVYASTEKAERELNWK